MDWLNCIWNSDKFFHSNFLLLFFFYLFHSVHCSAEKKAAVKIVKRYFFYRIDSIWTKWHHVSVLWNRWILISLSLRCTAGRCFNAIFSLSSLYQLVRLMFNHFYVWHAKYRCVQRNKRTIAIHILFIISIRVLFKSQSNAPLFHPSQHHWFEPIKLAIAFTKWIYFVPETIKITHILEAQWKVTTHIRSMNT